MSNKSLLQISRKSNIVLPVFQFKNIYKIHRQTSIAPLRALRYAGHTSYTVSLEGWRATRSSPQESEVWWAGRVSTQTLCGERWLGGLNISIL